MTGKVFLVGAGPGDAGLLTVRAAELIAAADLIAVDALVSADIVERFPKSAEVVYVGKRAAAHTLPQDRINQLLIDEARKGKRVVRLKGGDPFVFGRGGEEAEHLRAHGVEVDVVSGITSGVAAAAALGVPLTHRDHAHGVIFVTGHARADGAALHWPTLGAAAAQGLTLVIYMGVTAIETLSEGLLQALPGTTPTAIVQHASRPQQRVLACTLDALAASVRDGRIGSPAIVIVGDVLRGMQSIARPIDAARAA